MLAACRTPSKATELQRLVKKHPGQLHLLTQDVTNENSIEVHFLLCFWLCPQAGSTGTSCEPPDAA